MEIILILNIFFIFRYKYYDFFLGWKYGVKNVKAKNPLYEYFNINYSSGQAMCKLCHTMLKFKCSKDSTTLKRHLKSLGHMNDGTYGDFLKKSQGIKTTSVR